MKNLNINKTQKRIDDLIRGMTLEQKVGQALTLCFNGSSLYPLVHRQIKDFHCAGLRVTQSAIDASRNGFRRPAPYVMPDQYASCLNSLQKIALDRPLGIPLHFSADQEGDFSSNYCMGGVHFTPSLAGLTACGDPKYAYDVAKANARQLRAVGIHWIHSPTLDVNVNSRNPEIGPRAFSDDADTCAEYARAYLEGCRDGGLIACGKHFPGRGDSDIDAHHAIISLDIPKDVLLRREMKPYTDNLDILPSIMIAHSAFPSLDPSGLPATVSRKILTDFLRVELGYKGVITTDNMEMEGLTRLYSIPEGSWRALAAGADIVLMKSENEKICEAVFNGIIEAVERGDLPLERLEEANRRVLSMKMDYGIFDHPFADQNEAIGILKDSSVIDDIHKAVRQGIRVERNCGNVVPLRENCRMLLIEQRIDINSGMQADDIWSHTGMLLEKIMRYTANIEHVIVEFVPAEADFARVRDKLDASYDVAVVTHWTHRSLANNSELVSMIREKGIPVISLSNNPYPHSFGNNADAVILFYLFRGYGLEAVTDVLFGKESATGRWPLAQKSPG